MATHTGGCHCGSIRYEVDMPIEKAIDCNCSHCAQKGFLLSFVPAALFKMVGGSEDIMSEYRFHKKRLAHRFCATCGVQTHSRGNGPDGSPMVAVNIRTLDGGVPEHIEITTFEGKDI